jgi:tetratricopeptide (TPR) repeat protein
MKMKSKSAILAILIFAGMFLSSCAPKAVNKEMPITTSSKEALAAFIDGRNQAEINQGLKSIDLFKKAIALDPEFALAYAYLAISDATLYIDNYSKAMSLMNKISKGEQVFLQMWDNQRKSNGTEMRNNADTLLKLFPEDKRIPFFLGGSIYYADDEKAISFLNKCIILDTAFAPAYRILGSKYRVLRNFPEAEKNLLKYQALLPSEPDPYSQLSAFYRDEGKLDKALEMASKIPEVDPGNSNGFIMMGNCYIFTNEYEKARENFMKRLDQISDAPRKLTALYYYSLSYVFEGNMDEALKSYDKYIDLAGKNKRYNAVVNMTREQAWVSLIFNDLKKAKFYLDKAEELIKTSEIEEVARKNFENSNGPWRGFLLTNEGNYSSAEKELETYKALIVKRNMPSEMEQFGTMLGFLRFKQGKYDEAIDFLTKAGNYPFNWYYIGAAYEAKKDKLKAKEYYDKVASFYLVNINNAAVHRLAIERLKKL